MLGAAVIDDILGLILLAVVSSVITTGSLELLGLMIIVAKAVGFLVFVVILDRYILRPLIRVFSKYAAGQTFFLFPFVLLMFLAWFADRKLHPVFYGRNKHCRQQKSLLLSTLEFYFEWSHLFEGLQRPML